MKWLTKLLRRKKPRPLVEVYTDGKLWYVRVYKESIVCSSEDHANHIAAGIACHLGAERMLHAKEA